MKVWLILYIYIVINNNLFNPALSMQYLNFSTNLKFFSLSDKILVIQNKIHYRYLHALYIGKCRVIESKYDKMSAKGASLENREVRFSSRTMRAYMNRKLNHLEFFDIA